MRWTPLRHQWHELARILGTAELALFGWLQAVGAEHGGLFEITVEQVARELATSRRRALQALYVLAKLDDPPILGDRPPIIAWDGDNWLGYVYGWNIPGKDTSPYNTRVVNARIRYAKSQPPSIAVDACLAELALHDTRWVPPTGEELGLATMYREAFTGTGASMPSSADIAEGTPLRIAMAAAWTKVRLPEKAPWPAERWHAYFQAVAAGVLPGGTFRARQMVVPVSLLWLLDDETMVAVRGNASDTNRKKVNR